MKVYIFHHTQDLQDYNEHEVFATMEGAQTAFNEAFLSVDKSGIITEIYTHEKDSFYFETRYGQEKLYITQHEL